MTATCPVCRRVVAHVSDETGWVPRHRDTAEHLCPMSGHRLPVDEFESCPV